jgi:hypothetical protein
MPQDEAVMWAARLAFDSGMLTDGVDPEETGIATLRSLSIEPEAGEL